MKLIFFLIWSEKCITVTEDYDNQEPKFAITDKKLYVPVVTLSAQDSEELLQQLKQVFKEQLAGININQNQQHRHENHI